jgi:hypothetical protein
MLLCELDERAISPRSGAQHKTQGGVLDYEVTRRVRASRPESIPVDDLAEPMKTKKNAGHKAQHIS